VNKRLRNAHMILFLSAAMWLGGCGESEPPQGGTAGTGGGDCVLGSEGCACNADACLADLLSNVCVDAGGAGGTAGAGGIAGTGGTTTDLCMGVDCDDGNQCTVDGECDPATGECEGGENEPNVTRCNQNNGSICDGEGSCVECNQAVDCPDVTLECKRASCDANRCGSENTAADGTPCDSGTGTCQNGICEASNLCLDAATRCNDGNECTGDLCSPANGTCSNPNEMDGTACDFGGAPGVCTSGTCTEAPPLILNNGNPVTWRARMVKVCPPGGSPRYSPLDIWIEQDNFMLFGSNRDNINEVDVATSGTIDGLGNVSLTVVLTNGANTRGTYRFQGTLTGSGSSEAIEGTAPVPCATPPPGEPPVSGYAYDNDRDPPDDYVESGNLMMDHN